ncbi:MULTISPECIES: hypothetical protein [Caballeronia]|uniref:hypothetical protein n=1 Tax=Caballeronia TaxID=1827195 RepID=UPI00025BAD67|nr:MULTISPECIES: hypothetical protein [Caballeronia]EKS70386.1 hypothetical protein BURK_019980 [Burkholderia sp. SJ98]MCE4546340.1 hypothetical protein [Caballeronia sp. PC1]MCE4573185.1 hypothetical protein [Caballeronia sp. CLC5]
MNQAINQNASRKSDRIVIVDNVALFDELATCAEHAGLTACAAVAKVSLPKELHQAIPETHVLAFAVPSNEEIDWDAQAADMLVPHNEIDFEHRQATSLFLLGNGPVAFEPKYGFQPLFGSDGSLFVFFLHRATTYLVRYSYSERFLNTWEALDASAGENYQHDDERAARSIIVLGSPVSGAADNIAIVPAAYFEIESDGRLSQYFASARIRSRPDFFAAQCPDACSWND